VVKLRRIAVSAYRVHAAFCISEGIKSLISRIRVDFLPYKM
jgi:hypothetical protein